MYRTHTCGELRENDSGKNVTLAGWVHSIRLHGGLAFIDLRDRYGITQLTINTEDLPEVKTLRREFVIQVKGIVRKKPEPNKKLETGAIELFAEELRQAQQALGEITGEFTSDDLLGEIFSNFCIGK